MTDYYEENIEYVTEQTIEQEIRNDIEGIRVDTINDVKQIKQDALDDIEEIRVDTVGEDGDIENVGEVNKIKDDALFYIEAKKEKLVEYGYDKIIYANETCGNIDDINKYTDVIAENTIAKIELNIREMIVNNGYDFQTINDENGNVDLVLVKEVAE